MVNRFCQQVTYLTEKSLLFTHKITKIMNTAHFIPICVTFLSASFCSCNKPTEQSNENLKVTQPLKVSDVRNGFTPQQAKELSAQFSNVVTAVSGGDASLFGLLNWSEVAKTIVIARQGQVAELKAESNPMIGQVRFESSDGNLTLDEYLENEKSRVQGFIVVHRGKIVFEKYPGMRPSDYHVWMSSTKPLAALMVRMLEEEGKVQISRSITDYVHWLKGTDWDASTVADVLDMKTGMGILETRDTRVDSNSFANRVIKANASLPHNGTIETLQEVIRSAKRLRPSGEAYEYSSTNTILLGLLCEAVTGRRWSDYFQERVWSKIGVEGDMLMGTNPQGVTMVNGEAVTRLRDKARFGMLFTPSWNKVSKERIVSEAFVQKIMSGGDTTAFIRGGGFKQYSKLFRDSTVKSNHYQWDAIFADGDFHKNGMLGQGLYVSPKKDLVIAFFSTRADYEVPGYARSIAKQLK